GVILRARDAELGRDLAVKVLHEGHRGNPAVVRRFLEEARISGQLQHPGVVPIHEVGRSPDGCPFFVMKLIQGRTLADLLAHRAAPGHDLTRFVGIFEQVCQTVGYAHARGVIHRDLKPSNIMVGEFGEVQVMDWGLAKASPVASAPGEEADSAALAELNRADATQLGAVMGTPAYMAPEQARGERVDERADVFGLGAILCEILTGDSPYADDTRSDVLGLAAEGRLDQAHARLVRCGADAELVALALACLETRPADRPGDAGEVARRVTAYRHGVAERL